MNTSIVTYFDYSSWKKNGINWFGSFKQFADFDGRVIVFAEGLPDKIQRVLANYGCEVILPEPKYVRSGMNLISAMGSFTEGNYVYWNSDVYFQSSIQELIESVEDKLLYTMVQWEKSTEPPDNEYRVHSGVLAGPWYIFRDLAELLKFRYYLNENTAELHILSLFIRHFSGLSQEISPVWNYCAVSDLQRKDSFYLDEKIVPVINPYGSLFTAGHKCYLFESNYPHLTAKWKSIFSPSIRRIIRR